MTNTNVDTISFGALLRRRRLAAALSQEALAERAGLSARGISNLERGVRRLPRLETVRLLSEALRLSPEDHARFVAAARRGLSPEQDGANTPSDAAMPRALPAAPTELIGRDGEVAVALDTLRRDGVRLLTLTGPGGIGKTRLALEVAAILRPHYEDGAIFVDLAVVSEPSLVATAIARAVGIQDVDDYPYADRLAAYLCERRLLLVLDNFEHVVAAAPLMADLLTTCPRLTVLTTSRAAMRVHGERELPVPPLALPAETARMPIPPEALREHAATDLFVRRARAARPGFTPTAVDAPAIAAICRHLDGLPLAIELAAARIKLLSPLALLDRLDKRLPLLVGGALDLPERQRTMRAAIAWSYDLLHPCEQALFRRLAVFVGGTRPEAAEVVCGSEGEGAVLTSDVLLWLESLLDKSLLRREESLDGEPRVGMLETVREYGLERLATAGEEERTRRRHAAYYVALAEQADREMGGPGQLGWLNRLEQEHDNLRVALRWALGWGDVETGLRLVTALWLFWHTHGHLGEGRGWLDRALSIGGGAAPAMRAKALNRVGWLALFQGEYAAAKDLIEESASLYRGLGDTEGLASSLVNLGFVAVLGERGDISVPPLLEEITALRPGLLDKRTLANLLILHGLIAGSRGDWELAVVRHEEALALFRTVGDVQGAGMCLGNLGLIAFVRTRYAEAADYLRETLRLAREADDKMAIQYGFLGLANVAMAQGQPARAVLLWGAAEAVREAANIVLSSLGRSRTNYDGHLAAARAHMGETDFAETWTAGRALPLEQAIADALSEAGG